MFNIKQVYFNEIITYFFNFNVLYGKYKKLKDTKYIYLLIIYFKMQRTFIFYHNLLGSYVLYITILFVINEKVSAFDFLTRFIYFDSYYIIQIYLLNNYSLIQVEIARKLGEDFMPLLPETMPFLAEILEDEDETTEKCAQNAVCALEEILGEPLQKYF